MSRIRASLAASVPDLAALVPRVLVVLVAAEFVLLRLMNRVSGLFPSSVRGSASEAIVVAGTFAYNAGFVLGILCAILIGVVLYARARVLPRLLLVGAAVLVGVQAVGSGSPAAIALADGIVASNVVVLAAMAFRAREVSRVPSPTARLPHDLRAGSAVLFAAAAAATILAALYLRMGDALANVGLALPARDAVYGLGEATALAAAFLAAAAFGRRPDALNVGVAVAGASLLVAWAVVRPSLLPLIAFWSLGFQMSLAFPLYPLALAALLYAVVSLRGPGSATSRLGLLLLVLGGRHLLDFYFVEVALIGLLLVALGPALPSMHGAAPAAQREASSDSPDRPSIEVTPRLEPRVARTASRRRGVGPRFREPEAGSPRAP